jgi:hypothetical protein
MASDAPGPETLRSALADPVTGDYLEVDLGTPGVLEGPFDVQAYADSFQLDAKSRETLINGLNKEGFVAGYARTWYTPGSRNIWMAESILVFQADKGSTSARQSSKLHYATDKGFGRFVDTGNIPQSFGLTYQGPDGFKWTVVVFSKGNDVFAVIVGSAADYMTASALGQATTEYASAPDRTSVPPARAGDPPSALASGLAFGTALVVFLLFMVAVGSVIAAAIWMSNSSRSRPHPDSALSGNVGADRT